MRPDQLSELLQHLRALNGHIDYLESVTRPAFSIDRSTLPLSSGTSRFAGLPDLLPDDPWPFIGGVPYRFLCQVNFGHLPDRSLALPRNGLLSLFFADLNEDGDPVVDEHDPEFIKAYFYPADLDRLRAAPRPAGQEPETGVRIRFERTVDLPRSASQRSDWPSESLAEAAPLWWSERVRPELRSGDKLLGYPDPHTTDSDVSPGPDWIPLLSVQSHDDLEWGWCDGHCLIVFVERERLAVGDFSRLRSVAA